METLSNYQKTLEALSLRLASCEQLGEAVPVSGPECFVVFQILPIMVLDLTLLVPPQMVGLWTGDDCIIP